MAYCKKCGKSPCKHPIAPVNGFKKPIKQKDSQLVVTKGRKRLERSNDCGLVFLNENKTPRKLKGHRIVVMGDDKKPETSRGCCAFVMNDSQTLMSRCLTSANPDTSISGTVLTVRSGFRLELPKDFFASFEKRTTTFNLRFLSDNGQKLVLRWVKGSHNCNFKEHIKNLITASETTAKVISSFSEHLDTKGWRIRVVKTLKLNGPKELGIEPFVKNLETFSTNSLWEINASRTYEKAVVALIHYSYVCSGGAFVLTNLEGGVDDCNKIITLLPPTLLSGKTGGFGCRDLGTVKKFEKYHTCNSICEELPRASGCKKSCVGENSAGVFEIVEE